MISTEPITDTQKFKTYNAFRLLNAVFRELALHSSKVKVQDQLYAVYLCCCAHNLRTEEHIKFNFVEMLHDHGMIKIGGREWLSGRVLDFGPRGPGFEYRAVPEIFVNIYHH